MKRQHVDLSPDNLRTAIIELRQAVAISGIPDDGLMGSMLEKSLEALEISYRQHDWESVRRGLANAEGLLSQCTL